MSDSIFGAAALSGYSADPDLNPVTVGTVFYVRGGADGWTARGVRIWPADTAADLSGCYAYLYGLGPTELLAVKQFPGTPAEQSWTDVTFDTPVLLSEFPAGRMYVAAVYMPDGGFAFKSAVFSTNVISGDNTNVVAPEANDAVANGPVAGNGVFLSGSIANPAAPPTSPTFQATGSNVHYGVDVLVLDPADAPPEAPSNTAPPTISGIPQAGRAITCSTGSWLGTFPISFTRQWKRDGVSIAGATSASYAVTQADIGAELTCLVTATNSIGSTSDASAPVTGEAAPAPPGANVRDRILRNGAWYTLEYANTGLGIIVRPESFGALRDGETDDTEALATCILAAAEQARQEGTNWVEVQCSPGVYQLDTAPTAGGDTLGYSQIPLPAIAPETDQKLFLSIKGCGKASALHWAQTEPLSIATVFRSSAEGLTAHPTYGAPSVIGTPSVQVGSNPLAPDFSNIHVVLDGLTVMKPQDPSLVSFDLRGAGQASIGDIASVVNATVADLANNPGSDGLGVGLMMPAPGNNAICDINAFTSEGDNCGIVIAEHVVANRILCLYNELAVFVSTGARGNSTNHGSTIQYLCAEAVNRVIEADQTGGVKFQLQILSCDTEIVDAGSHIVDTTNLLRGICYWHDYQATAPRINGATGYHVYDTANNTHYGPAWTEA